MKYHSHISSATQATPGSCTFLVGAGVSVDAPCGAPSGLELSAGLIERLSPNQDLATQIKKAAFPSSFPFVVGTPILRFEHLVEGLMQSGVDPELSLLTQIYGRLGPNYVHKLLARACSQGAIVLTTNFDTCIERCLGFKRVVDLWSRRVQTVTSGSVVKLHGSIRRDGQRSDTSTLMASPRRLVMLRRVILEGRSFTRPPVPALGARDGEFTAQTHTILPSTVSEIVSALATRPVVVIGYSGMDDFDLVPILLRLPSPHPLIWIDHKEDGPAEVLSYSTMQVRNMHRDGVTSKAEKVLMVAGASARRSDRVVLIRGHSGRLLAEWYGEYYWALGKRLDSKPILDNWITKNSASARALSLASALGESGHHRLSHDVLESNLLLNRNQLDRDGLLSTHCLLSTFNIVAGRFDKAGKHAAAALALAGADAMSRAHALTATGFVAMQVEPLRAIGLFEEIVQILEPMISIRRAGRATDWRSTNAGTPRLYIGALINLALLRYRVGRSTRLEAWAELGRLSRLARGFGERSLELKSKAERLFVAEGSISAVALSHLVRDLVGEASEDGDGEVVDMVGRRLAGSIES